jgi:DHA1 family bicyclomycin/chloramphenicol resistance-like MFS transporter
MKKILRDFKQASLCVPFWQTTIVVSLIFAGYIAFLAGISVLFVIEFGIDKTELPFFQAAILGAWLIASMLCNKAMAYLGKDRLKTTGTVLIVLGGTGFALAAIITPQNPYLLTCGMLLYAFGSNWVQSLYFPEGMELLPDIKGVTSSLLTSARLLITAAIVGVASQLYDGTIYPLVGTIVGIVAVIIPTIIMYERKRDRTTETTTITVQAH